MNDTELDEMLDKWEAPAAPASLRAKVQAGFSPDRPRHEAPRGPWHWITSFTPRKTVLGGIAVAVGALLCLVTLALPQTLILSSPPYTVESKCMRFADERGPAAEMILTSYNDKGSEIVLSRSLPGNLFGTVATRVTDAASSLITRFTWPVFKPEQLEIIKTQAGVSSGFQYWYLGSAAELQHGCVNGPVVGREKILDYQTTAVEYRQDNYFKFTVWRAPGLGCFALRLTDEERQDDGTYRLIREKRAFHVTLNH